MDHVFIGLERTSLKVGICHPFPSCRKAWCVVSCDHLHSASGTLGCVAGTCEAFPKIIIQKELARVSFTVILTLILCKRFGV